MRFHLSSGFSAVEMLVSLAIVVLLALTAVFTLGNNKDSDELKTAARLVSSDLRNIQARALSGSNTKACTNSSGALILCEESVVGCTGTCSDNVPLDYGVYFMTGTSTYYFFADLNSPTPNYRYDGSAELLQKRSLGEFAANVIISAVSSTSGTGTVTGHASSSAAFVRQSGAAKLMGYSASEPAVLDISIKHAKTGKIMVVELNRVTGRITIL